MRSPMSGRVEPRDLQPPPYSSVVNEQSYKYVSVPLTSHPDLAQVHGKDDIFGNINPSAVQHSGTTDAPTFYYNVSSNIEEAIPDQRIMVLDPPVPNATISSLHQILKWFFILAVIFAVISVVITVMRLVLIV